MFISEKDAFRVLDIISKFSTQHDFLLSVISTLHTAEECDYLISLIDKGILKSKSHISAIALLISVEREKAKPKEDYLKRVNRRIKRIEPWERFSEEIKDYCKSNGLSYDKLRHMAREHFIGEDLMLFSYLEPVLTNEEIDYDDRLRPPLVLTINYKDPENLVFRQTEHTRKYIGADVLK